MIGQQRLETILASLPRLTIALVGDLFLDCYLEIDPDAEEISVETGLPAHQVTRVRNAAGALGTVMNNLASLGVGTLVPVTVIGNDGHGYDLRQALAELPVDDRYIQADPDRLTPTYTKPLTRQADGTLRELSRLDVRTRGPLSDAANQQLCRNLQAAFEAADGLIVLDQLVAEDQGVVDRRLREQLQRLAASDPDKLIYVDSRAFLDRFHGVVLKGNREELCAAAGLSQVDSANAQRAAEELAARNNRTVFCTLGEEGILVARPGEEPQVAVACPVSGPVDIVGAGDSASAGIVSTLLSGGDEIEAAQVGNLVASITVQQLGTTGTATPEQVLARRRKVVGD